MRLIILTLLYFLLATSFSSAQDVFVRQNITNAPVDKKTSTATTAENMDSFSKRYYTNCMSKKDNILKGDNQKKLCSCSAEHMNKSMTVENIKAMSMNSKEGESQRRRMLLEVYAPCIQYPASALLYENCISGNDVKTKLPDYQRVCGCMATNMGFYINKNGPAAIADSIAKNPNDQNPLASLMNSAEFQAQAQAELLKCVTGHK